MSRNWKRYERGGECAGPIPEGQIILFGQNVYLAKSEILFEKESFTEEDLAAEFDVKSGVWYVEDGWIVGKNPEMCPGMIVSKRDFTGDILLEIKAKMVAPSTHDINMMIHGEWDDEKNERGRAYVAGLEAFWHGNVGFEKSPEYKLTAATSLLDFDPEKEYLFQLGNVGRKLFVVVDGQVALEVTDPEPFDMDEVGKIGFEAFSSWWKFKDLRVYKLTTEWIRERYGVEF